jgi:hypothetical protein
MFVSEIIYDAVQEVKGQRWEKRRREARKGTQLEMRGIEGKEGNKCTADDNY